jgi:hypothetical protein
MRAYRARAHERAGWSFDGGNGIAEVAHWATAVSGFVVLCFEGEVLQGWGRGRLRGTGVGGGGGGRVVGVLSLGLGLGLGGVVAVRSWEVVGDVQGDIA